MKNRLFWIALAILALPQTLLAQRIQLDNTCNSCTRRQNDSVNVFGVRDIRVNQSGYRPQDQRKFAFVANPVASTFKVVNAETFLDVFTGTLESIGSFAVGPMRSTGTFNSLTEMYDFANGAAGNETLYRADFSTLSDEGRFYLVADADTSATFFINSELYNNVFETSLKFFGVNRCGDTDSWIHGKCHLKDGSALGAGRAGTLTGGWHDCGDHGKYSETVAYAATVLNLVYVLWPEKAEDFYGSSYNDTLPFGTDGIPDVLREAKVGVDYIYALYKESVSDGMVTTGDMYHSVGTGPGVDHEYWDQPQRQDAQPYGQGGPDRPVTAGIGSNVAGMYAASLAFFAWSWELFDPVYAAELGVAAVDIYDNIIMKNLNSNTSMPCCYPGGGRKDDDEAMAALALWYLTKDYKYGYDLLENPAIQSNANYIYVPGQFPGGHMGSGSYFHHGGWTTDYEQIHAFVLYALGKLILKDDLTAAEYGIDATKRVELLDDVKETMRLSIQTGSTASDASTFPGFSVDPPYNIVYNSQDWGFNRYNMGIVNELFMYWDLTGEQRYFDVALDNMNYDLGLNPYDISFLMGTGDKNQQHPHNRAANPDGYNAGGLPYEYQSPKGALMGGILPGQLLHDKWDLWTKTETCIDFSASFILPAQLLAKDLPPDNAGPLFSNVVVEQVDQTYAIISWQTSELSATTLRYALSPGGVILDSASASLSLGGVVTLLGLQPATTYYFYLEGMDVRHNVSSDDNHGQWYSFTTKTNAQDPATISDVRICNVTAEKATVFWWTANGSYDSRVSYGSSPALGLSADQDDTGLPGKFHQVTLTGLSPQTTYYLDVHSGLSTDDNGGAHYTFTTPDVFVDYGIYLKPLNGLGGDAHLIIDISNNEPVPYTGLEFRFYFSTAGSVSSMGMQITDATTYDVNSNRTSASVSVGSPVPYTSGGLSDVWYLPVTVNSELPVAGRLHMKTQITVAAGSWTPIKWDDLTDAWSVRPHTIPASPEDFEGLWLQYAAGYNDDIWVEEINGVPTLAYQKTPYVTAHYNGQHVYGYPPDWQNNLPQSEKNVTLFFDQPFTSPQTSLEIDSFQVNFAGWASAHPDGKITSIEVDAQEVTWSLASARGDSATFDQSFNLDYGSNTFTWVAWHNKEGADCACTHQRVNIEVDTLVAPRERRYLLMDPSDLFEAYVGKRKPVTITLSADSLTAVSGEDISIELRGSDASLLFYATQDATTSLSSIALVNGTITVYVEGSMELIGANILISNFGGSPEYLYLPGVIGTVNINARPPWPLPDIALAVDTGCDQKPDLLRVWLSQAFGEGQSLASADIFYGDDTLHVAKTELDFVSDTVLQLPFRTEFSDGTPEGRVLLNILYDGKDTAESEVFSDGIGPVLTDVSILENLDPGGNPDSLYVQFSERIKSPGRTWPFVVRSGGSTISKSPMVDNAVEFDQEKFIWLFVLSGNNSSMDLIREGYTLQLAEDASITDLAGNGISDCERKEFSIRTKYRPVPMLPGSGKILDSDGDGLADRVTFEYAHKVDEIHLPDSFDVAFGTGDRTDTLSTTSWNLASDGVSMTLSFEDPFVLGITHGPMAWDGGALVQQFKGSGADFESNELVAADHVGPVLLLAFFASGRAFDSLQITASEALDTLGTGSAYLVRKSGGDVALETSFKRRVGDSIWIFHYTEKAVGYVQAGDEIRFSTTSSAFGDKRGNFPSSNNPYVTVLGSQTPPGISLSLLEAVIRPERGDVKTAYGDHAPLANEHFRLSVSGCKDGTRLLSTSGGVRTVAADYKHLGPTLEFEIQPINAEIFDYDLSLDVSAYDNLGQFVNRFVAKIIVDKSLSECIDIGQTLHLQVEWLLHEDGLQDRAERLVASGAYISRSNMRLRRIPKVLSNESRPDSKSFSKILLFGYLRF